MTARVFWYTLFLLRNTKAAKSYIFTIIEIRGSDEGGGEADSWIESEVEEQILRTRDFIMPHSLQPQPATTKMEKYLSLDLPQFLFRRSRTTLIAKTMRLERFLKVMRFLTPKNLITKSLSTKKSWRPESWGWIRLPSAEDGSFWGAVYLKQTSFSITESSDLPSLAIRIKNKHLFTVPRSSHGWNLQIRSLVLHAKIRITAPTLPAGSYSYGPNMALLPTSTPYPPLARLHSHMWHSANCFCCPILLDHSSSIWIAPAHHDSASQGWTGTAAKDPTRLSSRHLSA